MMTWKGLDVRTLQMMGELRSPYTAEHLITEGSFSKSDEPGLTEQGRTFLITLLAPASSQEE